MRLVCIALLLAASSAAQTQDDPTPVRQHHFRRIHGLDGISDETVHAAARVALIASIRNQWLDRPPERYEVSVESRTPPDCVDCTGLNLDVFRRDHWFPFRHRKKCLYRLSVYPDDNRAQRIAGPIIVK